MNMKNNKSPGIDGFTTEFYKTFWKDMKDLFMESLKWSIQHKTLPESSRSGLITLILKPGKDACFADSYRPITLLNVDYKIISSVINNRLRASIPSVISHWQNGFVKQRHIGDSIRLLFNIIGLCRLQKGTRRFTRTGFKEGI